MPHVIFVIVTSSDQSILLERKLPDVVLAFISTIRFTNSFLNPVSYAVAQPLFRRTVAGMICNPKQYCWFNDTSPEEDGLRITGTNRPQKLF